MDVNPDELVISLIAKRCEASAQENGGVCAVIVRNFKADPELIEGPPDEVTRRVQEWRSANLTHSRFVEFAKRNEAGDGWVQMSEEEVQESRYVSLGD